MTGTEPSPDVKETPRGRQLLTRRRIGAIGLMAGVVLSMIIVLSSGYMIEATNTDRFCVSCHSMTPFRTAWRNSVHGGRNPQGFAAQCVDCHLPHGNFVEYLTAKAITGTGDVIQSIGFDPAAFDWEGNAEEKRAHFTYDSGCRRCHHELIPPGIGSGGISAHREYLNNATAKKCADCHPHVGHLDMIEEVNRSFRSEGDRHE